MNNERFKRQKRVHNELIELRTPSPPPPGERMMRTPRKNKFLAYAEAYKDQVKFSTIYDKFHISKRTGYNILKSTSSRSSENLGKRGRKRVFTDNDAYNLETIENASYSLSTLAHYRVAKSFGYSGSERTIQRVMKRIGVGTYVAAQAKGLSQKVRYKRVRYFSTIQDEPLDFYKGFAFSDEAHAGLGPRKRQKVHRRRGFITRYQRNKIQFRFKRKKQALHFTASVFWHHKSRLYFYEGTGKGGKLTPSDYKKILKDFHLPSLQPRSPDFNRTLTLLEDNDSSHGTEGKNFKEMSAFKAEIGLQWHANCGSLPDINVSKKLWRTIKQRARCRHNTSTIRKLKFALEHQWNGIPMKEIRKLIKLLPERCREIISRDGDLIPW